MDNTVLSGFLSLGERYAAYAGQVRAALSPVNKANEDALVITKVLEMEHGGKRWKTYLRAKYDD